MGFGSVESRARARQSLPATPCPTGGRQRGEGRESAAGLARRCRVSKSAPALRKQPGAWPRGSDPHDARQAIPARLDPVGAGDLMAGETSPAVQFYVRDWIISTRVLTPEARGIYIDLIAYGWDYDGIPDDPGVLAAMVGMTPQKFRAVWAAIEDKWPIAEEGKRRNPRQEQQRRELKAHRDKQAENGKRGAEKRWGTADEG